MDIHQSNKQQGGTPIQRRVKTMRRQAHDLTVMGFDGASSIISKWADKVEVQEGPIVVHTGKAGR